MFKNMLKYCVLFIFIFSCFDIKTQNLVPNGDFEEFMYGKSHSKNGVYSFSELSNWGEMQQFEKRTLANGPVLVYKHKTSLTNSYPRTMTSPFKNETYIDLPQYNEEKSIMAVKLKEPLKKDKTYCLRLWVLEMNRDSVDQYKLQFLISRKQKIIEKNGEIIDKKDILIEHTPKKYTSFWLPWRELAFYFTAKGAEEYLYVGNFNLKVPAQILEYKESMIYDVDDISLTICTDKKNCQAEDLSKKKLTCFDFKIEENKEMYIDSCYFDYPNIFRDVANRDKDNPRYLRLNTLVEYLRNNSTKKIDIIIYQPGAIVRSVKTHLDTISIDIRYHANNYASYFSYYGIADDRIKIIPKYEKKLVSEVYRVSTRYDLIGETIGFKIY